MGTSWPALIGGGVLIGLGASVLLLMNGRVAGISGILSRILEGHAGHQAWRLVFLAGLVLPVLVAGLPSGVRPPASLAVMALAGLLVGLGTRLGNGCTSGHGVCGIANLSPRSFGATLLFMGAAMLTVYLVRHA